MQYKRGGVIGFVVQIGITEEAERLVFKNKRDFGKWLENEKDNVGDRIMISYFTLVKTDQGDEIELKGITEKHHLHDVGTPVYAPCCPECGYDQDDWHYGLPEDSMAQATTAYCIMCSHKM